MPTVKKFAISLLAPEIVPGANFISNTDICLQAHEQGVDTLLSGWGGDELITHNGANFFLDALYQGRLRQCVQALKSAGQLNNVPFHHVLFSDLLGPWMPEWVYLWLRPEGRRAQLIRQREPSLRGAFIHADLRTKLLTDVHTGFVPDRHRHRRGVRDLQLRAIQDDHMTKRLEANAVQGARFGIQFTYPLLDRRLIEFALRIPTTLFFKDGYNRWIFRQAMDGYLPDSIRLIRSKAEPARSGIVSGWISWAQAEIIPLLHRTLSDWINAGRGFNVLDIDNVQKEIAGVPIADRQPQKDGIKSVTQDDLILAVKIEQLVNPALAMAIRERLDGM